MRHLLYYLLLSALTKSSNLIPIEPLTTDNISCLTRSVSSIKLYTFYISLASFWNAFWDRCNRYLHRPRVHPQTRIDLSLIADLPIVFVWHWRGRRHLFWARQTGAGGELNTDHQALGTSLQSSVRTNSWSVQAMYSTQSIQMQNSISQQHRDFFQVIQLFLNVYHSSYCTEYVLLLKWCIKKCFINTK